MRRSILGGAVLAFALVCSATSQSPLCTINPFLSNNSGSVGGAVYFDLNVTNGVILNAIDTNYSAVAGTAVGVQMYTIPGTSVGNEANMAAWTLVAQGNGASTSAGTNLPTAITLSAPVILNPGTYGMALVAVGSGHAYTNGTGANQNFSTAELAITLGKASNAPFTANPFTPRVWNGCLRYTPAAGLFPNFTAAPTSGAAPLMVNFTDTTYTSDPGGVLVYQWDIDNNGSTEYFTRNASHTYTTEGIYSVRLITTDSQHGSVSITKTNLIAVDTVDASFTFALGGATAVNFTDTSTGSPTSWAWDFTNDGTVDSNAQHPTFVYPAPGSYQCKLTVADAISSDSTTVTIGVSILPIPPFQSTFSSATATRGFFFQTPVRFSFTSLKVPDETAHGLQNVAVYNLGQAPPQFSATIQGTPVFYSAGTSSAQPIPCAISFDVGDWVGILGGAGDATTMRSSYGAGNFASSLFGQPVTLLRMLAQTNFVSTSGVVLLSAEGVAQIARVECGVSAAASIPHGVSSPSSPGGVGPVLTTTALPRLGQNAQLTATLAAADAGALCFFSIGLGQFNIPTPLGTLNINPLASFGIGMGVAGANTFTFPVPNTPSLNGARVNWQNFNIGTGSIGVSASNGQEWDVAF